MLQIRGKRDSFVLNLPGKRRFQTKLSPFRIHAHCRVQSSPKLSMPCARKKRVQDLGMILCAREKTGAGFNELK